MGVNPILYLRQYIIVFDQNVTSLLFNSWSSLKFYENLCIILNMIKLENLMFIWPCIVIYFYSKTNQMHQFLKFILFWNNTLHVSDGLSVHHQQLKTVHIPVAVCTVLNS